MADKKVGSDVELKVENKGSKKEPWSLKKIATTVIIVILALLMIGGSFYYIFSPGFSKDSTAFGFYNGQPINYEQNNVFGRTLMSDQNYINASATGDYTKIYSSWYQAYQTQVLFEAISQTAKKAKMPVPRTLINKMMIATGIFNDENGKFSEEKYRQVSQVEQQNFYEYIKEVFPYQVAVNDITSTLVPEKEVEFVSDINKNVRNIDYFVVDYTSYPNYLARIFASDNKNLFKMLDLSMITCSTEEEAKAAYDALKGGMEWKEAVKTYSKDNYAAADGKIGSAMYATIIKTNLADEADLDKLVALGVDEYTEPIKGPYAYSIYKADAPVVDPDFSDKNTLAFVKSIVYSQKKDEVTPYIDKAVAAASASVNEDFDETAEKYSSGIINVIGANNNVGNSQFVVGLQYSDVGGLLRDAAAKDEQLSRKLFTAQEGDILDPISTDNGTIFVRIGKTDAESPIASSLSSYYGQYAGQLVLTDLKDEIISNKKHEDKFAERFIETFFKDAIQSNGN